VRAKRALDLALGIPALILSAPILAVLGVAMRVTGDRGPFLYRAVRNGEGGRPFTLLKVRTMSVGGAGSRLTGPDDRRVTRMGRPVRRLRLDELPQLVNVLRGEMSLVGPRPEDPAYIDFADPLHARVFRARPGITGLAQLEFHDEAALLGGPDPDRTYREVILPAKLRIDADYLDRQSVRLDVEIIARTVGAVFGRDGGSTAAERAVGPGQGAGGGNGPVEPSGADGGPATVADEASPTDG
jgi:lipopolysaccharide/colanic/teichoic acid biosynthesis glycosyltransferase